MQRSIPSIRFILGLVAICAAIFQLSGCSKTDKLDQVRDVADKWSDGDLTGALTDVEGVLKASPDNEYAWTLLGHVRSAMDQDSLAMEAYSKALAINDSVEEAITGQGVIYRRWGRIDEAAERYMKAIRINPEYAQAHSSLMVIELIRGEYNEAVRAGKRAYDLDSTDPAIAANLSLACYYAGDSANREYYFDRAAELGYTSLDNLRAIFSGSVKLFDTADVSREENSGNSGAEVVALSDSNDQ